MCSDPIDWEPFEFVSKVIKERGGKENDDFEIGPIKTTPAVASELFDTITNLQIPKTGLKRLVLYDIGILGGELSESACEKLVEKCQQLKTFEVNEFDGCYKYVNQGYMAIMDLVQKILSNCSDELETFVCNPINGTE